MSENKQKMVEIPEEQLESLVTQLEESKRDAIVLKESAIAIMDLMGLMNEEKTQIKPGIVSGKDSFIPGMLKSLSDIVALLTQCSAPKWMGGDKAKEKLEKKFSFVSKLVPVINKSV